MALTTMMKHYLDVKEEYKDAIVLYRLGDFYEMFFDDAIKVSELLGITLTGRDCGLSERAPMCGIPFHSISTYLPRLIEHGLKVAICEQVSKPGDQKGIVARKVVKVVTKGTLLDSDFLNEETNNYLASLYYNTASGRISIAWADVSTGELYHQILNEKINVKLNEILTRINPSEIICNQDMLKESIELSVVKHGSVCPFSLFSEVAYDYDNALIAVSAYFDQTRLKKIKSERESICAIGALLAYIKSTQMKDLCHMNLLEDKQENMSLDFTTRRNLEILETVDCKKRGSLLSVIDRTSTAMGARQLKNWLKLPILDEVEINERLDCVEEFVSNRLLADELTSLLKQVRDLERLNARVSSGEINPKECLALASSLRVLPNLRNILNTTKNTRLKKLSEEIAPLNEVSELLLAAICDEPPCHARDGGFIREGFDRQFDEYKEISLNAKTLLKQLEQEERTETGIRSLKISFNKVFGYYIEITKSNLSQVPYRYIRKQTVATGERYITEELKELEQKILGSEENSITRELELYLKIVENLKAHVQSILSSARAIAYLDCLLSHALVSIDNSYVKPQISREIKHIKLVESRHPVVEFLSKNENFVPNDVMLDNGENRINLITGPNMAGKSVYMRQVAIIAIMAHIGCFVPAKSAEISIIDKIFTRIGASDDLGTGRSTFMVEMSEVANILENATDDSLLLFDEVGRGTSTYDGLSISWSLLEYLSEKYKSKIMFSTHYHELTELEGKLDGIKNYKLTIREINNDIVFLRKVMRGSANKSFGIEVAALSGLPNNVIARAKDILKRLEQADINNKNTKSDTQLSIYDTVVLSEILSILKDTNTDAITPRHALDILIDLKEKAVNAR